ncbi:hypothetical protein [Aureimonas populi]|uniref:Uncharacterized protein n=1 Tax=Aureimonas populi TaxID=1701758 RepID=A0ABW5CHX2_9HYPH|nr:hypothetical protein [Aureimonas populi]
MISYLTDAILVLALAATAWRTGVLYRELRLLRSENSEFRRTLEASEASINRAAHAVVMLKSEGVRTIGGLEERIAQARAEGERLDYAIRVADLRFALAEEAEACARRAELAA